MSNGQAEDLFAAALLARLAPRLSGWRLHALPLVGEGRAFETPTVVGPATVVTVHGPRRRLPADGLTMHHPRLLWADLSAGLVSVTWRQVRAMRAGEADAVLVVGDVFAQAMARWLSAPRSFVLQPLVSVRMVDPSARVPWNRAFMERIRLPELALLRRVEAVYARDEATAAWLRERGVAARFLGHPMMDGLQGRRLEPWPPGPTLALLPGSRSHAPDAVVTMLAALAVLADGGAAMAAAVAWQLGPPPPRPPGWHVAPASTAESWPTWTRGEVTVSWVTGRFADVLATADAALGSTGTAQEQAVGLGLPVVTFPVPPVLGAAFLANQARLLGPSLEVAPRDPRAIADAVRRALEDPVRRAAARADGPCRLGGPGGTEAIAADVAARLAGVGDAGPPPPASSTPSASPTE